MTRRDFGRALLFAALAAALTVPALMLGAFSWGYEGSLASYLLLLSPISLFVAAPDLRAGVRVFLLAGVISLILLCVVSRVETALLGTILILAVGRVVLSGPRPLARVLAIELVLGVLSFGAFAAFHDRLLIGDALAVWAFWLVQSGFALLSHPGTSREPDVADAFDAARSAAERVMQQSNS
jgi:hypothetical protein